MSAYAISMNSLQAQTLSYELLGIVESSSIFYYGYLQQLNKRNGEWLSYCLKPEDYLGFLLNILYFTPVKPPSCKIKYFFVFYRLSI